MVAPNSPSTSFQAKGSDGTAFTGRTLPLDVNGGVVVALTKADGTPVNPATGEGIEALATIFGAVVASPAANTVGARLKAIVDLLTAQNGYVDGLEGYLDGVEGLLTNLATVAAAPALAASEAHVGQVGGDMAIAVGSFARPADTTAYASGDLVANSVTPGSVAPVELTVARKAAGTGRIARARLTRSKPESGAFRIHLFRTAPVVQSASGDNLAMLTDGALGYLGGFDVTTDRVFSDGAKGFGVPVVGPFVAFEAASGSQKVFALIEARGAVNPSSAETFTIALEVDRD